MSATVRQDAPRYATLRDYVLVIRRYRVMIALIVVACVAAALVVTERQKATYQASATIYFQDATTQQLDLLGISVGSTVPDATLAQLDEHVITSPTVAALARTHLGQNVGSVSTAINATNNEVAIQASSPSAAVAQATANAYARATRTVSAHQQRAQLTNLVKAVKAQYAPLIAQAADPATKAAYEERIATLKVLARTAQPVQIVQLAALPTTPSGPRTVRNGLLGLVVGLTLALLAAFARDALDRRLRGPAQISEELRWPILGHIRDAAFSKPIFYSPNGKPIAEERDREAFRMLRQNLRFLDVDSPPRSIAVTSALAEEGKTTVAGALACAYAAAGVQTLLVDCDLRRPSVAERFGLARSPGLTDYLLGDVSPTDTVQVVELPAPSMAAARNGKATNGSATGNADDAAIQPRRLACITAGSRVPETTELLNSERFASFLRDVTEAYDQVVIDSGPLLAVADTTMLLADTQATLICIRSQRTTREHAAAVKQTIDRLPHRLVGVVVTGVKPGSVNDPGYYSYSYEAAV
jgi:Mrp family chromosome partitioning ATPase/capsular polysaccharide biosynthesis protein